ncbi:MAG: hypothetical protein ACREVB_13210, partial [Burkholderiales bacterium]
ETLARWCAEGKLSCHVQKVYPLAETPAALKALHASLSLELYREEFILERRPFAAHVTLIRKAHAAKSLPALPALDWPVREFVLMRSTLSSAGSAYEVLGRFPL